MASKQKKPQVQRGWGRTGPAVARLTFGQKPSNSGDRELPPQDVEGVLWSPPTSPAPPCSSSLGRLPGLAPTTRGELIPLTGISAQPEPRDLRAALLCGFPVLSFTVVFLTPHPDFLNSCTVSLIHLILEYWPPDVPTQAFPGQFSLGYFFHGHLT